ncbi:MAG: MCE family protein, partial [Actinomycetales bacterium]
VVRLVAVGVFMALCAAIFTFLWVNSGGRVPAVSQDGYRVTATMPRVANAVYFSDVMVAGVKVGKVRDVTEHGDHATVLMELDSSVAPLHSGATFEVRSKSLVEESFIAVTDGKGESVEAGHVFPQSASKAPVKLDDVLTSLDKPTRASITSLVRSSGLATKDSQQEISDALEGLGQLGREGGTALDALSDQSEDLASLTRSSTRVLAALAERRGQLSALVADADAITQVTAGQREDLSQVIEALPPLLDSATEGSDDLQTLATELAPVASNLRKSSANLSSALAELPETSTDLRGLVPSLDSVVDRAPATLDKVPALSDDVSSITAPAENVLADLNPVLGYLEPYGRDLAAWFTNFSQTIATGDVNGRAFRVMPVVNEQSFKGLPINTNIGPLDKFNPLPAAGSLDQPGPARQQYTRVTRDKVPAS